uniref:Uncharacterized protein n=1 Tax=Setaria digitata TaxID=48799 RepID=A0A915Q5H9_9BILA
MRDGVEKTSREGGGHSGLLWDATALPLASRYRPFSTATPLLLPIPPPPPPLLPMTTTMAVMVMMMMMTGTVVDEDKNDAREGMCQEWHSPRCIDRIHSTANPQYLQSLLNLSLRTGGGRDDLLEVCSDDISNTEGCGGLSDIGVVGVTVYPQKDSMGMPRRDMVSLGGIRDGP